MSIEPRYANHVIAASTPVELTLTFFKQSDLGPRMAGHIIMNPLLLPNLISLLQQNLERYEQKWGPLQDVSSWGLVDQLFKPKPDEKEDDENSV